MRKHLVVAALVLTVSGFLSLAACGGTTATPVSPSPSASAASPKASAASPSASAASPSASAAPTVDAEWAKVVEAAKKEGKVTMYGQWSSLVQDSYRKYFNAQYPEIALDFVTGSGSQTFQRIETEQRSGKVVADVARAGSTSSRQMKKAGFDEPFHPPTLKDPSIKWIDPRMANMDPEHYFNVFSFGITGMLVNTNLVKAGEEPKSYKELADPKWKGRIMAFTPKLSGYGNYWYTIIGKGILGPEAYAGPDYLEKMKAQEIRWSTNYDDGANLAARGESALFFPANTASASRLREAKAPIKFIQMSEGSFTTPLGFALVKGAPHPNAAKVFINWLGTIEGQKALDGGGDTPLRADVKSSVPENDPAGVKLLWFPTDGSEEALYPALKEAEDFFELK